MDFGKWLLQFLSFLSGSQVTTSIENLERSSEDMSQDLKKQIIKLSENFYLSELVKSLYAERNHLDNFPNTEQIDNLKALCVNVLQKIRDHYKKPVVINSGYRSSDVNIAIGGSHNSQHCKGEAADFEIPGLDNKEVIKWVVKNLDYDQAILEFYQDGNPSSGWIHVSYKKNKKNRHQCLRAQKLNGKTKYTQFSI